MSDPNPRSSNKTGPQNSFYRLVPLIALSILAIIFFWQYIFRGLVLARGDVLLYFYPYWKHAAEELRNGHIPLWNNYLFMGAPFLANSQAGVLYPLNWLTWYLLPAYYAISASIVLHIFIGGLGIYLVGRRCINLSRISALLASILFAFGGYVLGQVEHVNQLQGVAWLPWFLYFSCRWETSSGNWRNILKLTLAFAALFCLQLLSGHTQTAFITIVAIVLWQGSWLFLTWATRDRRSTDQVAGSGSKIKSFVLTFIPLLLSGLLALLISSAQLAPTLELAANSARRGGLPPSEVLSFSLHPLLFSAALLPTFDQAIFSEYVVLIPLSAIILTILGAFQVKQRREVLPALVLLSTGLFLAFGIFNPLYHVLARIPPFYLFRVPARWLVLFSLGSALLAGVGFQMLLESSGKPGYVHLRRPLLVAGGVIGLLIVWRFAAVPLSEVIPIGAEMQFAYPKMQTILGWIIEFLVVGALILVWMRTQNRRRGIMIVIFVLVVGAGYFISRSLPFAHPTTRDAFTDLRPPDSRLLVYASCGDIGGDCQVPPGRFLGLSDIFFDLGDQAEMDTIYGDQLSAEAQYELTVATKHKEIIGPNLPLAFRLPTVDGFDGGLLPLRSFTEVSRLILPEGEQTFDGRLRENLDSIPEARWLDLFNDRFIVTDKVGDEWREGIFFDLQHPAQLSTGDEPLKIGYLPDYEATELWLLMDGVPGNVMVWDEQGRSNELEANPLQDNLYRYELPRPMVIEDASIFPCAVDQQKGCREEATVRGVALRDSRDESFQTIIPGNYRLIHSGDVKIYDNLDVIPRAFLVYEYESTASPKAAIDLMSSPDFSPSKQAVIISEEPLSQVETGTASVTFSQYQPEQVLLEVSTDKPGLLVLTDAYYPGWQASIDGRPAEIYPADVLFRGVQIPAGEHEVVFNYEPKILKTGFTLSIIGLACWFGLVGAVIVLKKGDTSGAI